MSALIRETVIAEPTFWSDFYNDNLVIDLVTGDQLTGAVGVEYVSGPDGRDLSDRASFSAEEGTTYTFTVSGIVDSAARSFEFSVGDASTSVLDAFGAFELTVTYTATATGPVFLGFAIDSSATSGVEYTVTLADVVAPLSAVPTEGDDNLVGNMISDRVDLLGGNDVYVALGGSDVVTGGLGNDYINGVCGNDQLFGDEGNDTLLGGNGRDVMFGGSGADLMNGDNQEDTLNGGAGNDTLAGDKGDDNIDGGAGLDDIKGGTGDDILTGGAGNDIFRFARGDGQDVITDFTQGEDKIDLTKFRVWDISQVAMNDIEGGVRISTGDFNTIDLLGVAADSLSNADFILDDAPLVTVSEGSDIISGTEGSDSYKTAGGADRIRGLGGDDTIDGGSGQDTIDGGAGRDLLMGGSGKDQMKGGTGDDIMLGGADNDKLEGQDGKDILNGGNANDRLYGGTGDDTLLGENGNDRVWGGDDADLLMGGAGKDVLLGDAGNDTLNGGWGDDTLTGGSGADLFVFEDDRTRADTITDFEDGLDMIQIGSYGYSDVADLNLSQIGGNAVINLSTRDSITIENFLVTDLSNSDFDFV